MKVHGIEAEYVGPCMPKTGPNAIKVWGETASRLAPAFDHVNMAFEMTTCAQEEGIHYTSRDES
jgi:hypothetical protein